METSSLLHISKNRFAAASHVNLLLSSLVGLCSSTLVLGLAAFMWIMYRRREGQPAAPGPRGLPIIGHLHLLGSLPHQTLAHLSNSYGPLMSLRLGSLPLLVASSPDMAKLVLHTHDKIFSGRPDNFSVAKIAFSSFDIGFSQPGAVMMDMFVGGTDTSAVAIEWALAELLANPEKMKIVAKEIEDVVGCSHLLQESDLPNLPYLQAVVHETFRLHPVTPLLSPRMLMEPCRICNYYIPKNTLVYVNVWAIHRDPSIWSNPLEFSPERFLDSNINDLTQECKFLPFGAGRRTCPGQKLGILNVQKGLGNLIHAFDWKTFTKPHMNEEFALVTALEDPLILVPTPKSSNSPFQTII